MRSPPPTWPTLQAALGLFGTLLLIIQVGSLIYLRSLEPIPEELPAHRVGRPPDRKPLLHAQERPALAVEAAHSADLRALESLIRLLDARLLAAGISEGPTATHLAAARAQPDGPAVQALLADYGAILAAHGHHLDLTNNPAPGEVVQKPGPGPVPPSPPPSPASPPK